VSAAGKRLRPEVSPDLTETASPMDPGSTPSDSVRSTGTPAPARTILEVAAVLVLASVWFFWGTGVSDFVATEALRALVAKEMLEHDSWLVPTIHDRPYLRKPPLYAWTAASLGALVGRFDEQVARWPSAILGVLYVLTAYIAGRALVDPRAGPAAAVFAAGNWSTLDYGSRAELDIGVLAWTTLAVLLLGAAWFNSGPKRGALLVATYLAALAGSFWKAPHVLVTVGLTLVGLIVIDRRRGRRDALRFAFHPVQIVMAAACVAVFGWWFVVLSGSVGSERAGRFVLLEFFARVIPHSFSYFGELLKSIPQFIAVSLPACLFAAVFLMTSAREALSERRRRSLGFLLAWLVPTFAFLLFVPAKASRYWFLLLGAVVLLATLAWREYQSGRLAPAAARWCDHVIRALFGVAAVSGAACVILGVVLTAGVWQVPGAHPRYANAVLMVCGAVAAGVAAAGLRQALAGRRAALGTAFVLVLLAFKPIQVYAFLPARSALMTFRASAEALDEALPPDAIVNVLSHTPGTDRSGDVADLDFYSTHAFCWPLRVEDAVPSPDGRAYLIVRPETGKRSERRTSEDTRESLMGRFGDRLHELCTIDWVEVPLYVMALDAAASPPTATSPATQPAATAKPR
jgi:4-amino-4-deoxy-L-arabinose transferase-like glycosyltransferase